MATCRTIIDVQKGELTMMVHDQKITFNIFKAMKFPNDEKDEECFRLNVIDSIIQNTDAMQLSTDKLKSYITNMSDKELDDAILKCINYLDGAFRFRSAPHVESLELPKMSESSH